MSKQFEPITPAAIEWKRGLPYSASFDDIYFCEEGLQESQHVFIEGNCLPQRFESFSPEDPSWPYFVVGECGFGTGLNFLLTVQCFERYARPGAQLHFFSVEKYPLSEEDLARALALWPTLSTESQLLMMYYPRIHTPGHHHRELISNRIFLNLLLGNADEMWGGLVLSGDSRFEVNCRNWFVQAWFLDGFAPDKNETMWSSELFQHIALLSQKGTTLATFTSAGWVRRGLGAVGFHVEKSRGYGRKREMCVAYFEGAELTLKKRYTPWHVSSNSRPSEKKAIVLGAGLAGSFVAHELAKRSWEVILIDEASKEAAQASNNSQAVLYPNLSIYHAPLTNLMLHAYTYALSTYEPWIKDGLVEGELLGMVQLAMTEKVAQYQASLVPWLEHYPLLGKIVEAEEASVLAGLSCRTGGLYLPCSGWVNMKHLCSFLISSPRIRTVFNQKITALERHNELWRVGVDEAPVLVIATGYRANLFEETKAYELFPFQGQMTAVMPDVTTQHLKIPLCAEGHMTPVHQGVHWVGATYHQGQTNAHCSNEDDEVNLSRYCMLTAAQKRPQAQSAWCGVRASTRDHLPLVGAVPEVDAWYSTFQALKANRRCFIPSAEPVLEGLYLCAGFGSRGLTTIPWSAAYLAALIEKKPFACSRELAQSLSPARFLLRF